MATFFFGRRKTPDSEGLSADAYSRSPESIARGGHTYIQGMKSAESKTSATPGAPEPQREYLIRLQGRPLMGVLFSVSCDNCGEIYPLYVGRNFVGCEPEADVYLAEESVGVRHAVIQIRNIPTEKGRVISFSISDSDSVSGTYVNGDKLGFDKWLLRPGDIIRFGNCYEFAFQPLVADICGLRQRFDFKPVRRIMYNPDLPPLHDNDVYVPEDAPEVYPNVVGAEDEFTFYGRTRKKDTDHSAHKTVPYTSGKTILLTHDGE